MRITDYFTEEDVLEMEETRGNSKEEVLDQITDALVALGRLPSKEPFLSSLIEREALGTTAIGGGIAIPHARVRGLESPVMALFRFKRGIPFGALDSAPVYLIFLVLAPEEATEIHLRALARITSLLRDQKVKERLLEAPGSKEMYHLLREEDEEEG